VASEPGTLAVAERLAGIRDRVARLAERAERLEERMELAGNGHARDGDGEGPRDTES
jgi:hypothetical protein